ncbi:MAG: hypothetical protein GY754_09735 [bacterium]|nr:hypothetical protein [bacterium]
MKINRTIAGAIAFFFTATAAIRLWVLFSSPYAFGTDGYYYAVQIKTLLKNGSFIIPDSSLVLYYLAFFSLIGKNIVAANKAAIALLIGLMTWPAYLLGKNLLNKRAGLVLTALLVSNSFAAHFTFNFIKNLGGIFFFLFFLNQLVTVLKQGLNKKNSVLLAGFFFLTFATHKLMAGVALLFLVFYLLYFFRRSFLERKILFLTMFIVLTLSIITLSIFFPNILHLSDLSRVGNFWHLPPQLAPLSYTGITRLPGTLYPEIWLFAVSPFLIFSYRDKIENNLKIFLVSIVLLFLVIINPFLEFRLYNFAFRLFLLIFIPASIFLALFFASLKRAIFIIILLPLLLVYQGYTLSINMNINRHDYELYSDLLPLINLPENSLLVAHQGFDYFYCFNDKGKAFHFLPEDKHKNRPLYRLAHGVPPRLFKEYLGNNADINYLPGFYSLMKESTWQQFVTLLPPEKFRPYKNWRNPHEFRPRYMLRNQQFRVLDSAGTPGSR